MADWKRYVGLCALGVLACGGPAEPTPDEDTGTGGGEDVGADAGADVGEDSGGADVAPDAEPDADPGEPDEYPVTDCDPLQPDHCAYPWPSSHYLAPDETRESGWALTFGPTSLPRSVQGRYVDPTPFERLDGFGLGVSPTVYFPDLDIEGMATEDTIAKSLDEDSPTVWLSVRDDVIEKVPHWVELDARSAPGEPAALILRPAIVLQENTRYVVGMRNLEDTSGAAIAPSEAFATLRAGEGLTDPELKFRHERFEEVFAALEESEVARDELTLAWDFHTASSESLHGKMLKMRDETFAELGEGGPAMTVESVKEFAQTEDGSGREVHEQIAFQIEGTFTAPLYMVGPGPGDEGLFNLGADGKVLRNGTREAKFFARIPHSALDGTPHGIFTYGHGQLGSRYEIYADHIERLALEQKYILLAADLVGMSEEDGDTAQATIFDLGQFQSIGDRLHQGILEYLVLSRAAVTTLPALEEMTSRGVVIDTDHNYYFGASQGGIFGQTFMALTLDVARGFLAVPGANYNLLLHRSKNFDEFQDALDLIYRDPLDRPLIVSLLQLHWDPTDPISYVRHIKSEPFPGTPPHDALWVAAKGDEQVPVVSTEIVSRSIVDVPIVGTYDAERQPWAIPTVEYPARGSALILWDFGNPWPTGRANLPPGSDRPDPHSRLDEVDEVSTLFDTFLRTGEIVDVCGGGPCQLLD